uniref:Reverse transcriptase domain-containing protein n=1 Tax=Bactrocera latifrons TaxID=174628 RepID=A0A0K8TY11_BACLA
MSKVLEKIISVRIMWYAKKKGLISSNQFVFQKGLGVIDPLLYFEHCASTTLSARNHLSVLSLDFEKASDRIGAHIVLLELERWCVGDEIYNFLLNRKIFVSVNNRNCNVPQPLSVTLFIIAFNELSSLLSQYDTVEHLMYADDVLIFSALKDLTLMTETFTRILDDISNWSKTSGCKISANKSSPFHICRKHKCTFPILSLSNTQIPHTNTII